MVGIGKASPSSTSKYATYINENITRKNEGSTLSIYKGSYDPKIDYDKQVAVETHTVRMGYWPHARFPSIKGEQTQIVRGYIKISRSGRYSFRTQGKSICEINGKIVCQSIGSADVKPKVIRYEPGIYSIKVTYNGVGQTFLKHTFWDLPGTLHSVVKGQGKYWHLVDVNGNWVVRDDVWYKGVVTATASKWLTVGCGAGSDKIGPELGFGWQLGEYHDEPVLILKASQGNRSIGFDFLPPGSERYEHNTKQKDGSVLPMIYAGYKDSPWRWKQGAKPEPSNWYAGKQYDDCFKAAKDVLGNFDKHFPHWKGRKYEIAGFVWWQGHKDSGNDAHRANYEKNLVHLINTLRKEFDAPDAPFVVGTVSFGGWQGMHKNFRDIADAQLAVSDYSKYPMFEGNVKTVETRDFWKSAEVSPARQNFHYNQNGEVYYLVGDALGKGMIELLKKPNK